MASHSDNLCSITSTPSTLILTPRTRKYIEEFFVPAKLESKVLFNDSEISKLKFALKLENQQI